MFIYDDRIKNIINSDSIREIVCRQWREGDKWHHETTAHFNDPAVHEVKIDDVNSVMLSFYPCVYGYEIIYCHYDTDSKKAWIEVVPVIGWAEVLNNGLIPVGMDLRIATDDAQYRRYGLRQSHSLTVIEPEIATYETVEKFREDCQADFESQKK